MAKFSAPPPPARGTRITRSMSREPSLEPAGQRVEQQRESTSTLKRKGAQAKQVALPPVDEEEVLSDADQEMLEKPSQDDVPDLRSSRARSMAALSRETAMTGWSASQIDDLDPDLMVDRLQRVSTAADDLLDVLLPSDPKYHSTQFEQILIPNSTINKIFVSRVTSLENDKMAYGDQEYAHPEMILRAMLKATNDSALSSGPWRPDNIIYKVNLAQMLRRILITHQDPGCDLQDGPQMDDVQVRRDILFQLDTHFGSAIAGPMFNFQAFRLALEITAQNCIARLEASLSEDPEDEPNVSPTSIIDDAWYDDGYYRHAEALHLNEMEDEAQVNLGNYSDEKVNMLRAPFARGASLVEGITMLKSAFSWESFKGLVISYHDKRIEVLDRQIAEAGGVSKIGKLLTEELQRRNQARQAERRRGAADPSNTPRQFQATQLSKLKMRSARLAMNTPDQSSTVAQTGSSKAAQLSSKAAGKKCQRTQSPDRSLDERQQEPAASRPLSLGKVPMPKAKIRSFMDPQPNADRVEFGTGFDDDDDDDNGGVAPPVQSPNKRTYHQMLEDDGEEDFEPTQDQGFQTDTRDLAAANARRNAAPKPYIPTFQLVPSAGPAPTAERRITGVRLQSADPAEERRNPGSAVPPTTQVGAINDPMPPVSTLYQQSKLVARHRTISHNANKPPQSRTPWSEDEENTLLQLVRDYGTSWAKLKSADAEGENVLAHRTAEDLRFKARNMKYTLLASGVNLPVDYKQNWDMVKLSKKEIDKLHARGIAYAQERVRSGRELI